MSEILIMVDQYLHRWGDPDGELWFCLRPHLTSNALQKYWAQNPEALVSPSGQPYQIGFFRAGQTCPAILHPMNLPSQIEVWQGVEVNNGPPVWSRYDRANACVTMLDGATGPYSVLINQRVAAAVSGKAASIPEALEIQFSVGADFAISDVASPFASANGPNPVLVTAAGASRTSTFWLMGMMHRLGTRSGVAAISKVTGYDVVLTWTAAPLDATGQPQFDAARSVRLHLPTTVPGPAGDAERQFFSQWLPALPGTAFPASLDASIAVETPDVVYFKPPRRVLEREDPKPGADHLILRLADGDRQRGGLDLAQGVASGDFVYDPAGLIALELQVTRSPPADGPPNAVLTPGLRLPGRLKPYRKFPMLRSPKAGAITKDNGSRLPTVMIFEPDESCAALMATWLSAGAEAIAALNSALPRAEVTEVAQGKTKVTTWTLELLSAASLPWDGPRPAIRVLATPDGAAGLAANGEVRGLLQASARLFVPTHPDLTLKNVASYDLEMVPATATSAKVDARRVSALFAEVGLAKGTSFNAFNLANPGLDDTSLASARLTAAFQYDYEFERAISATRTEGVVRVTTAAPPVVSAAAAAAGLPDPEGFTPFRTWAQGWADYNVVRSVDESGVASAADWLAQSVAAAPLCDGGSLGVIHSIPFSKAWPVSPRDVPQNHKTAVPADWKATRDHVAGLYGLIPGGPSHFLDLELRNSYGASHALGRKGPVAPLDWPVDLPTVAEIRAPAPAPGEPNAGGRDARPFLSVDYKHTGEGGGPVPLIFDSSVLQFAAPDPTEQDPAKRKAQEMAFAQGVQAWRSLAELAVAADVRIYVHPVGYDLFNRDPTGVVTGLASNWRQALRDNATINAVFPTGGMVALKAWARACFGPATPKDYAIVLKLPANVPPLTQSATIAEVRIEVTRPAAMSSDAATALSIEKRLTSDSGRAGATPGDFRDIDKTIDRAWARASQDDSKRKAAMKKWADVRRFQSDSVTPKDATGDGFDLRKFSDVMQSLREGTDWFAPHGSPDYSGRTVQSILLPFGFSEVAPHPDLADGTEKALESLLTAYQDYIDLAFGKVTDVASGRRVFSVIEASVPGLRAVVTALVANLLAAQPSSESTEARTSPRVKSRAAWLGSSAATTFRARIADLLLTQPSVYASAKAFLLTELEVDGGDLSPLAGARYDRHVRPQLEVTSPPQIASVILDLARLEILDPPPAGAKAISKAVGFVEVLEDTAYDNLFDVRQGEQRVEPFEEVVDPGALVAKPGEKNLDWKTDLPETPILAEQTNTTSRSVHLASRRVVAPPLLMIAASFAGLQKKGLKQGDLVSSAKLYLGEDPWDAAGDLIVKCAWDHSQQPDFEEEIFSLAYVVRGDEEGDSGANTLFANDAFSLAPPAEPFAVTTLKTAAGAPLMRTPSPTAARLGALATTNGLTHAAYDLIEALVSDLPTVATDFVKAPGAILPEPTTGLQVLPDGASGFRFATLGNLPTSGEPMKDLRRAALLRSTKAGADKGTAILVLDFATRVWVESSFSLMQTRNVGTNTYAVSPAFRRGAAQTSPPARRRPTRSATNPASAWVTSKPTEPLSRTLTVKELLQILSRAPMTGAPKTLFTPAQALGCGYLLSITLHEEQFLRPVRTGWPAPVPGGRIQADELKVVMSPSGLAAAPSIVFKNNCRTFSVDLQWKTQSGDTALWLSRLFIRFAA